MHVVVLVNHDHIYESLYDVLNQRYVVRRDAAGRETRLLRLAVGAHSQLVPVDARGPSGAAVPVMAMPAGGPSGAPMVLPAGSVQLVGHAGGAAGNSTTGKAAGTMAPAAGATASASSERALVSDARSSAAHSALRRRTPLRAAETPAAAFATLFTGEYCCGCSRGVGSISGWSHVQMDGSEKAQEPYFPGDDVRLHDGVVSLRTSMQSAVQQRRLAGRCSLWWERRDCLVWQVRAAVTAKASRASSTPRHVEYNYCKGMKHVDMKHPHTCKDTLSVGSTYILTRSPTRGLAAVQRCSLGVARALSKRSEPTPPCRVRTSAGARRSPPPH